MRRYLNVRPDQTTRVRRNALSLLLEGAFGLFVEGEAAPGGGAAPAVAAPGAAAPAAAVPPAGGVPVVEAPAAAPAAGEKPEGNIVKDAPGAEAPAVPTADEQKAFLVEKGAKAEDLAKLSEADLKKAFDEKKAAEAKPADQKVKPEDIKITVPEGIKIDEKTMTAMKGILADATLTPEQRGQKLVDMHAAAIKAAATEPYAEWDRTQAQWQKDVKSDKELGGINFEPMQAGIGKLITALGGKEANQIRQAFVFTGAGNNPEIIRLLHRAAQAVNEPGHVSAGKPAPDGGKNPATVLYPNQASPKLANQQA